MQNNNNIYRKIQKIQSKIGKITKFEKNKYQNHNFFTEQQLLEKIKPFLNEYELLILLSDDGNHPLIHEKEEKIHHIKYMKKLEIIDLEDDSKILSFNFWACGSNADLAKAKGASETYAVKYILSKFFLIPVKDIEDPDYTDKSFEKKDRLLFKKW